MTGDAKSENENPRSSQSNDNTGRCATCGNEFCVIPGMNEFTEVIHYELTGVDKEHYCDETCLMRSSADDGVEELLRRAGRLLRMASKSADDADLEQHISSAHGGVSAAVKREVDR